MTNETQSQYSADAIEVLRGLDPVRVRPGMYTDTRNPNHLGMEAIDNSVDEAVDAVKNINKINRKKCLQRVEENFTIDKMVEGYEKVYAKIFQREGR